MTLVDVRLPAALLDRYALADISYPLAPVVAQQIAAIEPRQAFAILLQGLQKRASQAAVPSESHRAMERLAALLAEETGNPEAHVGAGWWVGLGAIRWSESMVTVQRAGCLIAALVARHDGRLQLATYRPLDARACDLISALAVAPHPEHGVGMRANNWEFALDAAAGLGQIYAAESGESYLSYWQFGLGVAADGSLIPEWIEQRDLEVHHPAVTGAMLLSYETPPAATEVH